MIIYNFHLLGFFLRWLLTVGCRLLTHELMMPCMHGASMLIELCVTLANSVAVTWEFLCYFFSTFVQCFTVWFDRTFCHWADVRSSKIFFQLCCNGIDTNICGGKINTPRHKIHFILQHFCFPSITFSLLLVAVVVVVVNVFRLFRFLGALFYNSSLYSPTEKNESTYTSNTNTNTSPRIK